jgi:hypothetical protein
MSTVGGGIYLHFLSQCSDEEEQQVFDKGWNFGVIELACFTSSLSKGLQEHCNKLIWNCCQSFNVKSNFLNSFSEMNGLFMFNACQDLMPTLWDFPNIKVWRFLLVFNQFF